MDNGNTNGNMTYGINQDNWQEWFKKNWEPQPQPTWAPTWPVYTPAHPCPSCGRCPTCGGYKYPYAPYAPYAYPTTILCSLN